MPDFVAPTYPEALGTGGLFGRYLIVGSASLVRDGNGSWSVVIGPSQWQLDAATFYYIGGYDNVIDPDHVTEMELQGLVDAGADYGADTYGSGSYSGLPLIDSNGYSTMLYWHSFSDDTYGSGDYGG